MANDGIKITAPVSITDIATVLGDSTDMGVSENVNIWSMNKPFEPWDEYYKEQTWQMRQRSAYGFYWWNEVEEDKAPFAHSAEALFDKAIANGAAWYWKKPETTQRMGDFDGYNHAAIMTYDYFTVAGSGQTVSAYIYNKYLYDGDIDNGNENAEIEMSLMPSDTGDMGGYYVKFLYREVGTNDVNVIDVNSMTVAEVDSEEATRVSFDVPLITGKDSQKTYECLWACMWEKNGVQYWVYYPLSLTEFIMKKLFYAYLWSFTPKDIYGNDIDAMYPDANNLGVITLQLRFINQLSYATQVVWTVQVWTDDYNYKNEYTGGASVGGGGTAQYFEITNIEAPTTAKASNVHIAIGIDYKTDREQTVWAHGYYGFSENNLMSGELNEDAGATVAQIITGVFE